ncbi:MAG: LysE family translocator [Hahellaceae bacterium]|nr:LysE family translocator [Hahellaceae bacterium]MCP5169377.1 LysE family translocator [Hahellaceae bacterium]
MQDSYSLYFALLLFAFATAGSPGPNNLMLTASGAIYGFRRTIPHMFGILAGFAVLNLTIAAGLGALFTTWPIIHWLLKFAGAIYLLYLAWRISTATTSFTTPDPLSRPFSFLEAASFQFVNPKAWTMNITAISTFSMPDNSFIGSSIVIIGIYMLVMFHTLPLWTALGSYIGRKLNSTLARQRFNYSMGGLTALSVMLMFV